MASTSKFPHSEYAVQMHTERNIAREIMATVNRLGLPFKLDQLTEGLGNCFPISIIQQCRRPEIFSQLKPLPKVITKHKTGQSILRNSVKQFITKSEHHQILRFKAQYEEYDGKDNNRSWEEYWMRR